jgi:hypothetical protein
VQLKITHQRPVRPQRVSDIAPVPMSSIAVYGGYCYLNLEYETGSGLSKFAIDLDYTGPMFGVSYRMAQ